MTMTGNVSQVMRIAMGLDDSLRAGAMRLAAAVDTLPFMASSPEAMYVGAHSHEAVASAARLASEGLELLGPGRGRYFHGAHEGTAHLHRLVAGGGTAPINDDLLRGSVHKLDDLVRWLGNPAH